MNALRTAVSSLLFATLVACTGGQEGNAANEAAPKKNAIESTAAAEQKSIDAEKIIRGISPVIPVYAGARYRDDLTRRDEVMIRGQYGAGAEVYTLATNDSYPQVFHYYTTYLGQFRAFPPTDPYPPDQQWRTLEVRLNQAMQDPFIPGDTLAPAGKQVILQIAETEAEPNTVIRYIVAPAPPAVAALPATQVAEPPPATVTVGTAADGASSIGAK